MHSGKVNKIKYDNLGKPMKQTNFTIIKQSNIIKRSFRSSTKHLFLDSTISVDELTAKTFYRFRTSELYNI